jgi:hypothetical protein
VVAVTAVVIVVVLILVLGFSGIIPIFHSNSKSNSATGNGGAVATYGQAVPRANGSVAGYQSGGWALIAASGYAFSEPTTLDTNSSSGTSGGCHFIVAPGQNANLSIPALSGPVTSGKAPDWAFFYRNGAGEVAVGAYQGGNYNVVGYVASGCSIFGLLAPIPVTGVMDSSTALAEVDTPTMLGGFLSSHPVVNLSMALIGGVSFLGYSSGAEWELNATTCPAESPSGASTGSWFEVGINATSGATLPGVGGTGSGACSSSSSSSTPTSYQLGFSQGPTNSAGGSYYDSLTIASVTAGLNTSYLQFVMDTSAGVPIFGADPVTTGAGANCLVGGPLSSCTAVTPGQPAWYLLIESIGGSVQAIYNPALATWTTLSGAPLPLVSYQSLVIISGTQLYLSGATLNAASDSSSVIISGSATL